jgi:hypothetical protein
MTEKAISPLRRRMIEDMTVRNFLEKTQKDYIRHVKNLASTSERCPRSVGDRTWPLAGATEIVGPISDI